MKDKGDPTELAGLYEGDIDMAYHEVRLRNMTNGRKLKLRNAIKRQGSKSIGLLSNTKKHFNRVAHHVFGLGLG